MPFTTVQEQTELNTVAQCILLKPEKAINLFSVVVFSAFLQNWGIPRQPEKWERSVWSIRTD